MTTVVEAEAAFKAAQDKKNAADSSLIDALSKEKELRGQLGRLLADSAPTTDVLAVRQDRDQTRQDVEDLEAAIEHLTADVATARQAVYQAKVAEARATMQEQGDALSTAVEALEAAIQNVVKFKRTAIDAGSKMRDAAITIQDTNPTRFSAETLVDNVLRDRILGRSFNPRGAPTTR